MVKDPEDVGRDLASTVDEEALYEEADSTHSPDLLPEVFRSFRVQFEENQQGAQHDLLETAFHDRMQSRHTGAPTKEGVVELAMDYARDAIHEYATFLVGDDVDVKYRDLPTGDAGYFEFSDEIVDGFWDGKQEVLERMED